MLVEDLNTSIRQTIDYVLESVIDESSETYGRDSSQNRLEASNDRSSLSQRDSMTKSRQALLNESGKKSLDNRGSSSSQARIQQQYKHLLSSLLSANGAEEAKDDQNEPKNVIAEVYTEEEDFSSGNQEVRDATFGKNLHHLSDQFEYNQGIRSENDTYDDESQSCTTDGP